MTTIIKKEIARIVKIKGSHIGVIKAKVLEAFPDANFEDYKEYAEGLISKKFKNVQSTIRASVRYQ